VDPLNVGCRCGVGVGASSVVGGTRSVAGAPVEVLLLDRGLSLDVVGLGVLGREVESVKESENETSNRKSDCRFSKILNVTRCWTYREPKRDQR
jgi:hypothetical protein